MGCVNVPAWLMVALCTLAMSGVSGKASGAESGALRSFTSTEFEKVELLADLPADVRAALDLKAAPMAEAGGDWNHGCVVDGRPGRRFIFAGRSPDLWFVFFEVGGRGHHQRVLTFRRRTDGTLEREGNWAINRRPRTIPELKEAVSANVAKHDDEN